MKFSICIPNYNYGRYISDTIHSALNQEADVEVLVSDNASTDDSVAVVKAIQDPRIRLNANRWNVGLAGNLDRACDGAMGDRMMLVSSDDLIGTEALQTYQALAGELGLAADGTIFCSRQWMIDRDANLLGESALDWRLWADATEDADLSACLGARVLRVSAQALLRRALMHLRNPVCFATTCYPRGLYEAVEGYGAGALMNPDKSFVWKLLSVANEVVYVDKALFSYRLHPCNQNAQQRSAGALKHLLDQYRGTLDTAPQVLAAARLTREDLTDAFVEHDVALRGLKAIAEGERQLARRHFDFGRAVFPALMTRSKHVWMLRGALALGPVGSAIARQCLELALRKYREDGVVSSERQICTSG